MLNLGPLTDKDKVGGEILAGIYTKEQAKSLPWWKKDAFGWPIETIKGRPIKNFFRYIFINIGKVWIWLGTKSNPPKVGTFESFAFPIIKNMSYGNLVEDLVSIQPMTLPDNKQYYHEIMDKANPRVGQVYHDEDKNPDCGGCCRDYWGKVYTPDGWIYEKHTPTEYATAVEKYGPLYKAEIKREEEEWNKEHGITEEDTCGMFKMTFVCDTSKNKET